MLIAYNPPPPAPPLGKLKPRLVDDGGKEFTLAGWGSGTGGKRSDYHFTFRDAPGCGKPSRLIVQFPTETRDIKIPFEFGKPPAAH
jgi:hypothetical protein